MLKITILTNYVICIKISEKKKNKKFEQNSISKLYQEHGMYMYLHIYTRAYKSSDILYSLYNTNKNDLSIVPNYTQK